MSDTQPYQRRRPHLCPARYPVQTDDLFRLDCVLLPEEHQEAKVASGETVTVHKIASGQAFFLVEEVQ